MTVSSVSVPLDTTAQEEVEFVLDTARKSHQGDLLKKGIKINRAEACILQTPLGKRKSLGKWGVTDIMGEFQGLQDMPGIHT